MLRRFVVVLVALSLALVAGCGNEKKGALEGLEKIKAACAENDKDLAKKMVEDLSKENKVFVKAFKAAIEGNSSPNYCSPLLHTEVQMRIEHGTD